MIRMFLSWKRFERHLLHLSLSRNKKTRLQHKDILVKSNFKQFRISYSLSLKKSVEIYVLYSVL
jgi:hypothetical protein